VDADLSDYFNTIPHGPLMKCLSRRIADGQVLSVIKQWLRCPVAERDRCSKVGMKVNRTDSRGTPQGGVISPLLANLYFRRFLLGWRKFGFDRKYNSRIVNYADDFVICCPKGHAAPALESMKWLMDKLGLRVNEQKTRLLGLPAESVDFLGYTIGRFYGKDGRAYYGTRPSRKAVRRLLREIHEETSAQWYASEPESRVIVINRKLRGWAGYFSQGPVLESYRVIRNYTERRLRRWFLRRQQKRGTGYRQYPDEYLYGKLGLWHLPDNRKDLSQAKSLRTEGRAGCGKTARPVRGAGTGNGTTGRTEAPALW
jgi:RNA-directed DNA polymerase